MTNKPRVIVTTDMECDDMNSLIHLCLYLNEIDLEGMIYTSSKFHFNGDGKYTLGEVESDYRCLGEAAWKIKPQTGKPDPEAKSLKEYRPFELGWIEKLWQNEYCKVLPYLNENAPGYPSVDDLMSITCKGNIAFEGDVRFETDGSKLIEKAILKEDDRPLYLLSWGGANTIVRALMSIYEKYHDQSNWYQINQKVNDTVRILGIIDGVGQDNSWLKYGKPLFPNLKLLRSEFIYGGYLSPITVAKDCNEMFHAKWLKENIQVDKSPLMKKYGLMGDGKYYEGFNHLNNMVGHVDSTKMDYIIRNHDHNLLEKQKQDFIHARDFLNLKYGYEIIKLDIKDAYKNMRSYIEKDMRVIDKAVEAMKKVDLNPRHSAIRGGTDGASLTYMGLPCPNLGTGGYNCHGKYEYVSINEMEKMVELLIEIAKG